MKQQLAEELIRLTAPVEVLVDTIRTSIFGALPVEFHEKVTQVITESRLMALARDVSAAMAEEWMTLEEPMLGEIVAWLQSTAGKTFCAKNKAIAGTIEEYMHRFSPRVVEWLREAFE